MQDAKEGPPVLCIRSSEPSRCHPSSKGDAGASGLRFQMPQKPRRALERTRHNSSQNLIIHAFLTEQGCIRSASNPGSWFVRLAGFSRIILVDIIIRSCKYTNMSYRCFGRDGPRILPPQGKRCFPKRQHTALVLGPFEESLALDRFGRSRRVVVGGIHPPLPLRPPFHPPHPPWGVERVSAKR